MKKRFLGIDYGKKRVGIAISDEEGKLAFPLRIIQNNPNLLDEIHNICGENDIRSIVIGESLNLSGEQNEIMVEINRFKKSLEELNLPIFFEKEFMTTVEARGRGGKETKNARKTKKDTSRKVDASAAALILQRYLDRKNKVI